MLKLTSNSLTYAEASSSSGGSGSGSGSGGSGSCDLSEIKALISKLTPEGKDDHPTNYWETIGDHGYGIVAGTDVDSHTDSLVPTPFPDGPVVNFDPVNHVSYTKVGSKWIGNIRIDISALATVHQINLVFLSCTIKTIPNTIDYFKTTYDKTTVTMVPIKHMFNTTVNFNVELNIDEHFKYLRTLLTASFVREI